MMMGEKLKLRTSLNKMSIKFSCLMYVPAANVMKESQTHIQETHRWLSAVKPLMLLGFFEIPQSFGLECSSISHIILPEHLLEIADAEMMVKVSVIHGAEALQRGCWHYPVYLEVAEVVDATSLLCVHVYRLTHVCAHAPVWIWWGKEQFSGVSSCFPPCWSRVSLVSALCSMLQAR